jgi:hypothetical protein
MLSIGSAIDYCPIAPFSLLMVPVREGRRSTDRKLPTSSDCNSTELKWLVPLPALKAKSQVPERQGLPGVRAPPRRFMASPLQLSGSYHLPLSGQAADNLPGPYRIWTATQIQFSLHNGLATLQP